MSNSLEDVKNRTHPSFCCCLPGDWVTWKYVYEPVCLVWLTKIIELFNVGKIHIYFWGRKKWHDISSAQLKVWLIKTIYPPAGSLHRTTDRVTAKWKRGDAKFPSRFVLLWCVIFWSVMAKYLNVAHKSFSSSSCARDSLGSFSGILQTLVKSSFFRLTKLWIIRVCTKKMQTALQIHSKPRRTRSILRCSLVWALGILHEIRISETEMRCAAWKGIVHFFSLGMSFTDRPEIINTRHS